MRLLTTLKTVAFCCSLLGLFRKLFRSKRKPVIIVSGLPRSGTSMMMKMLEAGGVDVLVDNIRRPNEDNPKGYYEFERVKKLPEGDVGWLNRAQGRAVKVIAALLPYLPDTYTYQVLFMHRHLNEILASQRQMLIRRGEDPDKVDDADMARLFEKHIAQVYTWMDQQTTVSYLDIDYNSMLEDPAPLLTQIQAFLRRPLDVAQMAAVVDPALYRQRR